MIVGLTGSIGTGKSTVSQMFSDIGAYLIDYDVLAREVVEPGRPAWKEIVKAFGEKVLAPDRTLDRKKLGDMVFGDKEKLAKLNAIVHPQIFYADRDRTEAILKSDPKAIIVKEIPLLTQIGVDPKSLVDVVVVVSAGPETQVRRVMGRGFSEAEARARIGAQVPVSETEKLGDFVIHNDGSLDDARSQVQSIYKKLKETHE